MNRSQMIALNVLFAGLASHSAFAQAIGVSDPNKVVIANQDSGAACPASAEIDKKAQPYRDAVKSIWYNDSLFQYAAVAKTVSDQLDKANDGELRRQIQAFKQGSPGVSADKIQESLKDLLDTTSSYADSIANKYNHPFHWYNPTVEIKTTTHEILVTVPTNVGTLPIKINVAADSASEGAQIQAAVRSIVSERIGNKFNPDIRQIPKIYHSEKEFLALHEHIPERCFAPNDPSRSSALVPPADTGAPLKSEVASLGRRNGAPVMGFPFNASIVNNKPAVVDSPFGTWNGQPYYPQTYFSNEPSYDSSTSYSGGAQPF